MIPNWGKFQHYKDRRPPWIKLYAAELEHKPEWLGLDLGDQGLLVRVWGLYALANGRLRVADVIRATAQDRPSSVHHKAITRRLKRLNRAGFIEFCASTTLSLSLKPLTPETRARENNRNGAMRVCPLCEVGGGFHAADCPTLQLPADPT